MSLHYLLALSNVWSIYVILSWIQILSHALSQKILLYKSRIEEKNNFTDPCWWSLIGTWKGPYWYLSGPNVTPPGPHGALPGPHEPSPGPHVGLMGPFGPHGGLGGSGRPWGPGNLVPGSCGFCSRDTAYSAKATKWQHHIVVWADNHCSAMTGKYPA